MNQKCKQKHDRLKTGKWKHIRWTSETKHIDTTTGELLTFKQLSDGTYIKLHTTKITEISQDFPEGHIEYTVHYEPSRQLTLF